MNLDKESFNENKENYNSNKENLPKENILLESKENILTQSKESISKDNDNMENVIANLRKAYLEMKNERLKTEKDYDHLEHKLKLLQAEELKAFKKFQNEKKFKEDYEMAKLKAAEFKKFLSEAKSKKKLETDEMSKKIKEMKLYIQRSLNVKKMMKFQENRLSNLQMKQKKIENHDRRRSFFKEEILKNKRMAESVKLREKTYLEKKKHGEEDKKKKIKKDLEEKLLEEQRKKKLFETKLNSLEEMESGLLKRMKNSEECETKKYRSSSTEPRPIREKRSDLIKKAN